MPIDVSRETTNVLLPKEVSDEIWDKTLEASAVMQLAQRRTLPGAGEEFQIISGEPEAQWVGETEEKPVSKHELDSKSWKGYKMAVIIPFSEEFRRDKERLYDEMVSRAPSSLGKKLDETVFGGATEPGTLFDTMADVDTVDIATDTWKGLVTADSMIADQDGQLSGWALAPAAKSILLSAMDNMNRPLFVNSMTSENTVSMLMGQPTYFSKGVTNANDDKQLGFAGDWTSAYYGVVDDITTRISDQSTLNIDGTQVNLWQNNMFAVMFEFEVGFAMKWSEHFVKLTNGAE